MGRENALSLSGNLGIHDFKRSKTSFLLLGFRDTSFMTFTVDQSSRGTYTLGEIL